MGVCKHNINEIDDSVMDLSQFYARRNTATEPKADVIVESQRSKMHPDGSITTITAGEGTCENTGKRLIGFLFSISHTINGEYWAVYLGDNVIGNGNETDICLFETSVSHVHATIHSYMQDGKLIVSISDNQSVNGTFVNGQRITETEKMCYGGDILTIGNNYQLLLLLADSSKYGLELSNDFQEGSSDDWESNSEANKIEEGTISLNVDDMIQSDATRII